MVRVLILVLLLLCNSLVHAENIPTVLAPGHSNEINSENLRDIFLLKKRYWNDGTVIKVFVLPFNNQDHMNFAKYKLKVFSFQLQQTWDSAVYSGTGTAPVVVNSYDEMKQKLSGTPGAVGYIVE